MSEYTAAATAIETGHRYEALRALVAERIATAKGPIFTTDGSVGGAKDEIGLFRTFLECLPEADRQHYTCHCCRRFFESYGGLVTIDGDGVIEPLLWTLELPQVPVFFKTAVGKLFDRVRASKVDGVFVTNSTLLGVPQTGAWTHFYGSLPTNFKLPPNYSKTAGQVAAEKKEDYGILCRGLAEYPRDAVVQAVRVLEADVVRGDEKAIGQAKWLLELHDAATVGNGWKRKNNLIWKAVATAPPGWCHVKTTMIATLLDDVVAGLPFDDIKAKWEAKMHPLRYQRPTTVKAGNLEAANKLIEKMGAEKSLERRYAKLDDVKAVLFNHIPIVDAARLVAESNLVNAEAMKLPSGWLWLPPVTRGDEGEPADDAAKSKPFDHLKAGATRGGKGKPDIKEVQLPAKKIETAAEFRELVRTAKSVEFYVDFQQRGYYALVTAVHADAPPIIQWDGLAGYARNPVTWFFRYGGVRGDEVGLATHEWAKVTAIFPQPCAWQSAEKFKHQGSNSLFLALEGCRWTKANRIGGSLFPAHLKSELESIKPAIERLSREAAIADPEAGDANGIAAFGGNSVASLRVRVDGREYLLPA